MELRVFCVFLFYLDFLVNKISNYWEKLNKDLKCKNVIKFYLLLIDLFYRNIDLREFFYIIVNVFFLIVYFLNVYDYYSISVVCIMYLWL